ncbi:MAG: tetratricopeptide repeat protein [Pseudomonadota bacterium]
MQVWAQHVQRFLATGGRDRDALTRAEKECSSSRTRAYLSQLPPETSESVAEGLRIVSDLFESGQAVEAAVLRVAVLIRRINLAQDPRRLPPSERESMSDLLGNLTTNCRIDSSLAPTLAILCSLRGGFFHGIQNFVEARTAYGEARDIRRHLVLADPIVHEPALAGTLSNLSVLDIDRRDFAAARRTLIEARDIYRRLAVSDPTHNKPILAGVTNNLGSLYRQTGEPEAALATFDEALDVYRALPLLEAKRFAPHLAGILNNLGTLCRDMHDFTAARAAFDEALDIRRGLTQSAPDRFASDLAATISGLGTLLYEIGELEEARKAFDEAIQIRIRLAMIDRKSHEPELAGTLSNLGVLLSSTDDPSTALDMNEKAVALAESATSQLDTYLRKGMTTSAYRSLLNTVGCGDPMRGFALACAVRVGSVKSADVTEADLAQTQDVLAALERESGQAQHIVFANSGTDEPRRMTLGLIGSERVDWYCVPSSGWEKMFLDGDAAEDNISRRSLSRQIWSSLPKAIRALLDPAAGGEVWISGDRFYSAFPWELLQFEDEKYLGLYRALPRIGSIMAPALRKVFEGGRLGRGVGDTALVAAHTTKSPILHGARDEAETAKVQLQAMGLALPFFEIGDDAHDGAMRHVIEARPDLLYYTGHGDIIADEEMLVLRSEERPDDVSYFGRAQLEAVSVNGQAMEHAPLVILNCCNTGRTREHGGQREDFVDTLFSHGAGAIIATALPIYDAVGQALGRALLGKQVLRAPDLATGLLAARRALMVEDITSPFWGAWSMIHLHGRARATHPLKESISRQIG